MEQTPTTLTSFFAFLNYLRPARSPYLIVTGFLVFVFLAPYKTFIYEVSMHWYYFAIPTYIVSIAIVILSFYFMPPELKQLDNAADLAPVA